MRIEALQTCVYVLTVKYVDTMTYSARRVAFLDLDLDLEGNLDLYYPYAY